MNLSPTPAQCELQVRARDFCEQVLQPLEQVGNGDTSDTSHLSTRDFCFPISEAERDTNPNIG